MKKAVKNIIFIIIPAALVVSYFAFFGMIVLYFKYPTIDSIYFAFVLFSIFLLLIGFILAFIGVFVIKGKSDLFPIICTSIVSVTFIFNCLSGYIGFTRYISHGSVDYMGRWKSKYGTIELLLTFQHYYSSHYIITDKYQPKQNQPKCFDKDGKLYYLFLKAPYSEIKQSDLNIDNTYIKYVMTDLAYICVYGDGSGFYRCNEERDSYPPVYIKFDETTTHTLFETVDEMLLPFA